jgi:hypothetical protein
MARNFFFINLSQESPNSSHFAHDSNCIIIVQERSKKTKKQKIDVPTIWCLLEYCVIIINN